MQLPVDGGSDRTGKVQTVWEYTEVPHEFVANSEFRMIFA
jgi:hypothetical protein